MRRVTAVLIVVFASCSTSSREPELARVRAHLEGAFAEVSAHSVEHLSLDQRARRAELLADLRDYIDAEQYPVNDVRSERTPIFVDHFGNRCAMAFLIERHGGEALVHRVAATANLARVRELQEDSELLIWLEHHGLTVEEAARIQPSYDNVVERSVAPTVAVLATGKTGATFGSPVAFELAGGPAVRLGARLISATTGACDHCVYQTQALFLEYARLAQLGRAGTNQLTLGFSADLFEQARDYTLYALGCVVGTVDEARPTNWSLGAQGGLGFGWRARDRFGFRPVPWFVEGLVSLAWQSWGWAGRLVANVGLAW